MAGDALGDAAEGADEMQPAMKPSDAPCRNCPSRFPACHDVCLKYMAWHLTRKKARVTCEKEREADAFRARTCRMQKEMEQKHKRG